MIVHEKCTFVDQQMIKLQELPDAVPVGELPRHIQICADRWASTFELRELEAEIVVGPQIFDRQSHSWLARHCDRHLFDVLIF